MKASVGWSNPDLKLSLGNFFFWPLSPDGSQRSKTAPSPKAHIRFLTFHSRQMLKWLGGPLGLEDVWNRIGAEASPGPRASIRLLTFHYREILKWLFGPNFCLGPWRRWKRIGAEASPGPRASIRLLTFHYREILKWLAGPMGLRGWEKLFHQGPKKQEYMDIWNIKIRIPLACWACGFRPPPFPWNKWLKHSSPPCVFP